ncbi:Competence protein [Dissulfuribacter thermophilus]|uniref:Competence protein n=2 Tax=Dissulfuribacter thermophilus TaxID=1156395 RepID=A0A1B9F3E7_9BACT|nr:Competence protein [Dissulfuribacter thermophilus]
MYGLTFPSKGNGPYKSSPLSSLFQALIVSGMFFFLGLFHVIAHDFLLKLKNKGLLELSTQNGSVVLQGVIDKVPVPSIDGIRTEIEIHGLGRLCLYIKGATESDFPPGELIRFSARLRPIVNVKTPGTFDRELWWKQRGIMFQAYTEYPLKCICLGKIHPTPIEDLRVIVLHRLQKMIGTQNAGIATAMVLGEKSWIDFSTKEAFFKAGIGHILAVSGLHLAIVATFFGILIKYLLSFSDRLLLTLPVKKISIAVGCAFALLYVALAGFSPSAQRAFLMVFSFGLAFFLKRELSAVCALSLSAWLIVLFNPYSLKNPGFLLSFFAVFFLIWYSPWINTGNSFEKLIKLTIIAWLSTVPLSSVFFHQTSLIAIPLNIIIIPVLGTILLPGLILTLLLDISLWLFNCAPSSVMWYPISFLINLLNSVVQNASKLAISTLHIYSPTYFEVLCFYLILFFIGLLLRGEPERRFSIGAVTVTLIFMLSFHWYQAYHGKDIEFYTLDVGQGLSQVIFTPKKVVLVDAGGGTFPYDRGSFVVSPFLLSKNRDVIDYLIISHYETDHAGGVLGVLEKLKVKKVIGPKPAHHQKIFKRIKSLLNEKGIPFRIINSYETISLGENSMLFIYPGSTYKDLTKTNDKGLVTVFWSKGRSILMPADIEEKREMCLTKSFTQNVDLLVAPHHGSVTSSSINFVESFRPKFVVFSYGLGNGFGLPDPKVKMRYLRIGSTILETPIHGTIKASIDQKGNFTISTYEN